MAVPFSAPGRKIKGIILIYSPTVVPAGAVDGTCRVLSARALRRKQATVLARQRASAAHVQLPMPAGAVEGTCRVSARAVRRKQATASRLPGSNHGSSLLGTRAED